MGKAFDLPSEELRGEVYEVITRTYKTADWPDIWAKEDAQRRGWTAAHADQAGTAEGLVSSKTA